MMEKLNLNPFGQSAQTYAPVELGKVEADTYNKMKGDFTGYDCPDV